MAKLSKEQQAKYHKLFKNRSPEVAQQYDQWVQAGKPGGTFNPDQPVTPEAPAGAPPSIDLSNPQSVINAQGVMNDRTVTQSTPNVTNDFGSRTITTDPVTGQKTVTEGLTGANKALMEQGQANQGMINTEFQKQMGYAAEQGKFDPRKGQTEQKAFDPSSMGQLPQYQDPRRGVTNVYQTGDARDGLRSLSRWEDPRNTQIEAPGSFRDMQQQTFRDALDEYTSSVREDQSFRRDALEQQMANEGIPRDSVKYQRAMAQFEKTADQGMQSAIRAAKRDSHDVGSQAFQNQLRGQGQEFDQNYRSGDQRFNQEFNARGQQFGENINATNQVFGQQMGLRGQEFMENRATGQDQFDRAYNARAQDAGFQSQQFGQQDSLNNRAERMTNAEYMTPYQIAAGLQGAQGQYKDPNMGATQSINTPTMDMLGYGTSYNNAQQQGNQFGQTMDFNRWAKQGDWNTSRSNAAASGGSKLADSKEMARYQDELARNRWWEQQGAGGNQGPQQSGWGDVGGNFVGGAFNGITNGMINNWRR